MKTGNKSGASAIWDGPLSQENRPHGKGSSNGANGMKLSMTPPCYTGSLPITEKAK